MHFKSFFSFYGTPAPSQDSFHAPQHATSKPDATFAPVQGETRSYVVGLRCFLIHSQEGMTSSSFKGGRRFAVSLLPRLRPKQLNESPFECGWLTRIAHFCHVTIPFPWNLCSRLQSLQSEKRKEHLTTIHFVLVEVKHQKRKLYWGFTVLMPKESDRAEFIFRTTAE